MQYPTILAGLPYAYCVKTVYRLSTSKDIAVGWDPRVARMAIDLAACMARSADVAERANEQLKLETGEDSVFAVAAQVMRATSGNWKIPVEADEGGGDAGTGVWSGVDSVANGMDMPLIDFTDDFWLSGAVHLG